MAVNFIESQKWIIILCFNLEKLVHCGGSWSFRPTDNFSLFPPRFLLLDSKFGNFRFFSSVSFISRSPATIFAIHILFWRKSAPVWASYSRSNPAQSFDPSPKRKHFLESRIFFQYIFNVEPLQLGRLLILQGPGKFFSFITSFVPVPSNSPITLKIRSKWIDEAVSYQGLSYSGDWSILIIMQVPPFFDCFWSKSVIHRPFRCSQVHPKFPVVYVFLPHG